MKYYIKYLCDKGIKSNIIESKKEIDKNIIKDYLKNKHNSQIAFYEFIKVTDTEIVSGVYCEKR